MSLEEEYQHRYDAYLVPLAQRLEEHLRERLGEVARVDRISARAKSVARFLAKADKRDISTGEPKYRDPLNQIQDQIGARIVTFYLSDVERVAAEVTRYYEPIEIKNLVPESPREFDYEGKHYILFVPQDIRAAGADQHLPEFFELQVKTLFQHAWSEANHDLGYKPGRELDRTDKRTLAFTSAQAWGADMMFDKIHTTNTGATPP